MKIGFIDEMLNDEAAMSRVDKRVRMYMVKRRTVAFTLKSKNCTAPWIHCRNGFYILEFVG